MTRGKNFDKRGYTTKKSEQCGYTSGEYTCTRRIGHMSFHYDIDKRKSFK